MGTASQGLVRFLYSVLIGRFVGVSALNNVNAAMSVSLLLSLLWPTSSGQAATRYVAQMRGEGRMDQAQAVANYLGRRMLGSAVVLGLATVAICLTVLHSDLATALCAGVLLLGYAAWSFTRGVQYGAGQIAVAAVWDVASSAAALIMLTLVLFFHLNAILLIPLALSYGAYGIVCWPRKSGTAIDGTLLGQMNRFVAYGVLGTLSSTGLLQLSMLGAHLVGTELEGGYYAAALSLATPATMLARTLNQVLFPVMAEAGGRGDASTMRGHTDMVARGMVVVMVPVFGTMALASPVILWVLYGEKFAGAADLLPVMLVAVMFTTLPVAAINRLNSIGIRGAKFVSLVSAGGLIVAVLLWLVLSPVYGVMGIALGYLVAALLTASVLIGACWKLDRQRWLALYAKAIAGVLVIGGGVVATVALKPPFWVGISMAVIFAALWCVLAFSEIRTLRRVGKKAQVSSVAVDSAPL
ncbi:lipopolysaccharide biosynthesis protein [Arthrobacter sp. TMN-49]